MDTATSSTDNKRGEATSSAQNPADDALEESFEKVVIDEEQEPQTKPKTKKAAILLSTLYSLKNSVDNDGSDLLVCAYLDSIFGCIKTLADIPLSADKLNAIDKSVSDNNNGYQHMIDSVKRASSSIESSIKLFLEIFPQNLEATESASVADISHPKEPTAPACVELMLSWRRAVDKHINGLLSGVFEELFIDTECMMPKQSSPVYSMSDITTYIQKYKPLFANLIDGINAVSKELWRLTYDYIKATPESPGKAAILKDPKLNFEYTAEYCRSEFDPKELAADPAQYLDSFIPQRIATASDQSLGWKSLLLTRAPPLVSYYVEHELEDVTCWEEARDKIHQAFKFPEGQNLQRELLIYSSVTNLNRKLSVYGNRYRYLALGLEYINAITTSRQQEWFTALLRKHDVKEISTYNFLNLIGQLPNHQID